MLGAIAAIALIVGSISATVSVTRDAQYMDEVSGDPAVEVRVLEGPDSASE